MFKVAAIQLKSEKNMERYNIERAIKMIIQSAENGAKIVCLPELWNSGYFTDDVDYMKRHAKSMESSFIKTFKNLAKQLKIILILPFPEVDKERFYISVIVINEEGQLIGMRRKSMLWGDESNTFTPGPYSYPVIETKFGKIGVLICYEIEFPEPSRLVTLAGANVLFVPSVWSKKGEQRWHIQLAARALDNQFYIVGVNASGGNACGKTKFITPFGEVLTECPEHSDSIIYGFVDPAILLQAKTEIPYLRDFPLQLTPGTR